MSFDTDLTIMCSDRGQHSARPLAVFQWQPDMSSDLAIWNASTDKSTIHPSPVAETVRATKAGPNRVTKRRPTTFEIRADGGKTYVWQCPTCRRTFRVQDVTLTKVMRAMQDTPGKSRFDLSYL